MNILSIVFPIFFVIGLGQVLRRTGFLDDKVSASFSRLVFYVAAPALLARATATNSLGETFNLPVLAVVTAATVFVGAGTYLACFQCSRERRGVIAQAGFRANQVFVGLPVVIYAYGEQSVNEVAVLVSLMVIVYNFQGVVVLVLPLQSVSVRSSTMLIRATVSVLKNPLIIACVAGILYSLTGLAVPTVLDRTLTLVGRTAAPLALLAVGSSMDFRRLRADIRVVTIIALVKTAVYPALVYAGLRLIGASGLDLKLPLMILASPTAVVTYVMVREIGGDENLAGAIIVGSTLLSLLTITGWLLFLG
jgi:predicted permease